MRPTLNFGKIAGIKIGIHYSWFIVVALIAWLLASQDLPDRYPGWSATIYWITGIISALLLFCSLLVHEFAHSLAARSKGILVEGITLFILGGISSIRRELDKPRDEILVAGVGPAISFILALLFWVLTQVLRGMDVAEPVYATAGYLWVINLVLALFNLLPAYPLDGGRIVQALVWAKSGSKAKAAKVSAITGQAFGVLLMTAGAVMMLWGNLIGGGWLLLVGIFVYGSARSSGRAAILEADLSGVQVKDVMEKYPVTIRPDATLSAAVLDFLMGRGARAVLVAEEGKLLGILTLGDVRNVPSADWGIIKVKEKMTPMPLKKVTPYDSVRDAMTLLAENGIHQVPVVDGDVLVGLLNRAHIINYMNLVRSRRQDSPPGVKG